MRGGRWKWWRRRRKWRSGEEEELGTKTVHRVSSIILPRRRLASTISTASIEIPYSRSRYRSSNEANRPSSSSTYDGSSVLLASSTSRSFEPPRRSIVLNFNRVALNLRLLFVAFEGCDFLGTKTVLVRFVRVDADRRKRVKVVSIGGALATGAVTDTREQGNLECTSDTADRHVHDELGLKRNITERSAKKTRTSCPRASSVYILYV